MKMVFFNKVLFEGTKEECEIFKSNLLDTLAKLDDELRDTYPMKQTDTYETYFEALKNLNPFIYETLCYLKNLIGDYFVEFQFLNMRLSGVNILVYTNLETKKTKIYTLGFVFNMIALGLRNQTIWKIEE
ncbi:MAG: hypothetical protein IJ282_10225 [Lachnospiraceae bacterium]|nr:hypothetical protein [Lachnospiraceae bacterium]